MYRNSGKVGHKAGSAEGIISVRIPISYKKVYKEITEDLLTAFLI